MDFTSPAPNRTDDVKTGSSHWYISYNNRVWDYGCDTTALVLGQMEYFLILNGDHREEFNKIIELHCLGQSRLKRCLDYVRNNKDKLNPQSDPII